MWTMQNFLINYSYPIVVIAFGILFCLRFLSPIVARWQMRLEENLERSKAKYAAEVAQAESLPNFDATLAALKAALADLDLQH